MSDLGNKEIMAMNINRLMKEHEKSRMEVCKDLGFSYMTFADWCNGKKYPRIDKIEMLANYFGVQKADLVEDNRHLQRQKRLVDYYNQLSEMGKEKVDAYIQAIIDMEVK